MRFLRCRKIRELLPWFVNGTLSEEERVLVERHLRRCRRCRTEVEELQEMKLKLGETLDKLKPSARLLEETIELIDAETLLREELLKILRLSQAEPQREMKQVNFGFFALAFSLGVAYERGRLPFEAELSALGLPLAKIEGRI